MSQPAGLIRCGQHRGPRGHGRPQGQVRGAGQVLARHCVNGAASRLPGGLKEALLNLPTRVSPGTGGLRSELLTGLAEVWQDNTLLEDFGMLYLNGTLL